MKKQKPINDFKAQAVELKILTVSELDVVHKALDSYLEELFWALKNLSGEKLKKRLRLTKMDYERRFTNNTKKNQNAYRHSFNKLILFIEDQIIKIKPIDKVIEKEIVKKEKGKSEITHYETLLALHYITYKANENLFLQMTKVVELIYYLRREHQPKKIADTVEYKQLKAILQNDKTKRKQLLKSHGVSALTHLKAIGLLGVSDLISSDIQ